MTASVVPTVPPCVGRSALFDSTEASDHLQAAALCRSCLMLDARAANVPPGSQYPTGTWAGRLYGVNARVVAGETFRKCVICDAVFIVSRHRMKYCSEECVAEGYRVKGRRYEVKRSRSRVA